MSFIALRLGPGTDLRQALDDHLFPDGARSGFVVAGLGSLSAPRLRFAGADDATTVAGPVELMSISGSLSRNGAHVHVTVATARGEVLGGHLCHGSEVRTTAELLLAQVRDVELSRVLDPVTGYKELAVQSAPTSPPSTPSAD